MINEFMKVEIAIIGLGYVGLPLAIEFAKKYKVIGYDIDKKRVNELKRGYDKTNEVNAVELNKLNLKFTHEPIKIKKCNYFIITVPTPVDKFNKPNLKSLKDASSLVGKFLKKNDIVIYESTVYPGCTEEDCVPLLEMNSKLKYNKDFYCGYSPERINPGDKVNTLTKIKKVTSGSTPEIGKLVDNLYSSIISAGTYLASSIKVAEASKVIENAQRDINISFVNELALIFDKINIDTKEVLDAAETKWNFLKYKPGLVGGHCISVDPYYLAYKAESLGYYPEVILSGRRVNSSIDRFVANKVVKLMIQKGIQIKGARALIIGITFKENCPDIRNTKVIGIYEELKEFGLIIDIYDPIANKEDVKKDLKIDMIDYPNISYYDSIIFAVPHEIVLNEFKTELRKTEEKVIFDLKSVLDKDKSDARL
jgi:UDP-N-acetyl-D-galactosamine dehydrogenase